MTQPPNSEYMKIAEAARFLGVTQRWVYRRVLSGELPASKVGGLYFINRKDLQNLLDAGRVKPELESSKEADSLLPRLKCGFCYRLLIDESEIAGRCEGEGCGEPICNKCWQLRIHTCARHSPTRDQRMQNALDQKQSGELDVLVKAESARLGEINFLNRIHARLSSYSTLIHPTSGEAIDIPSWEEILQTGDERAQLMHLLGKVALDTTTTSQLPLNAWHHYTTKTKNRKANPLELHVQVISHMEKMVRDGFDSKALGFDTLNDWIESAIESPARSGNYRLVLLASTTGWTDEAKAVITGSGVSAFSHRLGLLYLFDLEKNELIYFQEDDRARRYAELFRPVLSNEVLTDVIHAVIEFLGSHDSLTLDEAQRSLAFPAEKVKLAFEKMAQGGEFVLTDIKGMGVTLVRKQALS